MPIQRRSPCTFPHSLESGGMPPQKRKQPHDAGSKASAQDAPARRSTRQHPDAVEEPEHHLRSGRTRASATRQSDGPELTQKASRGSNAYAPKAITTIPAVTTIQTRASRHKATSDPAPAPKAAPISDVSKENVRPRTPPHEGRRRAAQTKQTRQSHHRAHTPCRSRSRSRSRSHSPPQSKPRPSSPSRSHAPIPRSSQRSTRPIAAATESGPTPAAAATITPSRSQPKKSKVSKAPGTPRSDRNIDTIVFGDTSFKAWYPSYYGKEVLGDGSANVGGGHAKIGGAKRDTPPLARLYVCPCCFKYSKEVVPWSKHVQYCGRKAFVPGTKVYTHPRHLKTVGTPSTDSASTSPAGSAKGKGKSTLHNGNLLTGDAVTNEGEWSVWEVDGEKDGLFCQNLSLFAKLFLDNKSVFFDVTGFNYFLLVYTPPPSKTHQAPLEETDLALESLAESANSASTSSNPHIPISTSLSPHPRPQIVGFFSKEKMSWDNNNLACILVFPPWQRKGLGALLMGVSYEISRREGILGGPEKPISELGRKGYRRFWAGEIIRWILGLDLPTSSAESADTPPSTKREREKEKERSRGKDKVNPQKSLVVDVEQCSRDTWIVLEDCLAVLREMGVVEEAGLGPPDNERDPDRDGAADANTPDKEKEGKEANSPLVSRIRIDKAAIRRWAHENKIELTRACDPDGFVEGYAIKRVEDNDGEE